MAEQWTVDDWEPTGKFAIMCREGNGYLVAILDKDNSQKQAANARLIAAAPELLKALKEAPELPLRMTAGEVEEFIVKYASWRLGWATLALDAATKEETE